MNIIVTFKVTKFRRTKLYMLKCAFLLAGSETSSGGLENLMTVLDSISFWCKMQVCCS